MVITSWIWRSMTLASLSQNLAACSPSWLLIHVNTLHSGMIGVSRGCGMVGALRTQHKVGTDSEPDADDESALVFDHPVQVEDSRQWLIRQLYSD